jgi:hypothetical protein
VSLQALAKFARARRPDVERCEACGVDLDARHEHLVDPEGGVHCACLACPVRAGWRRVAPSCARAVIDPAAWAALDVPVSIAFVVHTAKGYVVRYPSPAGLAQSPASTDAIARLGLALERDVEALLVRGTAAYRVSIDACYELAGVLAARRDVDAFFASLEARL